VVKIGIVIIIIAILFAVVNLIPVVIKPFPKSWREASKNIPATNCLFLKELKKDFLSKRRVRRKRRKEVPKMRQKIVVEIEVAVTMRLENVLVNP
jgi:hypothetical protein